MYPIFVFVMCCCSLLCGKVWQACIQQTENPLPHTLCSFSQVYMHALLVQHLQKSVFFIVYFFNCSKIRKCLDAEKAEKLV